MDAKVLQGRGQDGRCDGIRQGYRDSLPLLDDCGLFELPPGTLTVVTGPAGAGRTSLALALALGAADATGVLWHSVDSTGADVRRRLAQARERFGGEPLPKVDTSGWGELEPSALEEAVRNHLGHVVVMDGVDSWLSEREALEYAGAAASRRCRVIMTTMTTDHYLRERGYDDLTEINMMRVADAVVSIRTTCERHVRHDSAGGNRLLCVEKNRFGEAGCSTEAILLAGNGTWAPSAGVALG